MDSQPGPLSLWSVHFLPSSSLVLRFPPASQRCAREENGVSTLSQCERVGVGAPCDGRASCPGAGPLLCPELPGQTLATYYPELE